MKEAANITELNDSARAQPQPLVKSAERVLRILELLGNARAPIPVTELHKLTGYPRSSLHQLLHTMAGRRWIEFSPDGLRVGIGFPALIVGTAYLDRDQALRYSHRALEVIRERTGYTTHLGRLEGSTIIYLETREAVDARRAASRIGRTLPAYATALGKALLAELAPIEVAASIPEAPFPQLTPNTTSTAEDLDKQLTDIRTSKGYATEREENVLGVACVAVSVRYRIPATDAISCSIPLNHATSQEVERVANILQEECQQLADLLRFKGIR